ncbi:MAG: aminopeptidase P family protein [Bacteroidales bacterium]|nr:aminopeptidase P family protein [Bacteroidales bacterium]
MNQKLQKIRESIQKSGVEAYIIFNTDPHGSEYVPEDYLVIKELCGFTGDNAIVIITQNFAGLWTDSRYFISGEIELKNSEFELMKKTSESESSFVSWLKNNIKKGSVIAFDGKCTMSSIFLDLKRKLSQAEIIVNDKLDLTYTFWTNRPQPKITPMFILDKKFVGEESKEKIEKISTKIIEENSDALLIGDLFEIAWLLNLRASDIDYCPVFRAFMIVFKDKKSMLFISKQRINTKISDYLSKLNVTICEYTQITSTLEHLPAKLSILVDTASINAHLYSSINRHCKIIERKSPIQILKAQKNNTELLNIRKTMIEDGIAMEKFFYWFENQIENNKKITELDTCQKLLEYRKKSPNFISESFQCISAFNQHAAMPHYAPTEKDNITIEKDGVFLIDSGGQYYTGTTDLTRVIPTGKIDEEFAIDYTLVLKANINIALAKFPQGTIGTKIDAIGRIHLWKYGKDFGHGTGHGIGFCLNVHEGPMAITPSINKVAFVPGMVMSNEPGIYIENKYGIRIENLITVINSKYPEFYEFETLTLCHIDTRPIKTELLNQEEKDYINNYNEKVYKILSEYLTDNEKQYLKKQTQKIN